MRIQFGLDGALEFSHHARDLVHFLLGQFIEVLFQILGTLDATGFECRQQAILVPYPECLKTGFDGRGSRCVGRGLQRRFGFTHIEALKTTFDERSSRGDYLFMQAMIVAAQYDDAAMGDDYGVAQRGIIDDAGRDAGKVLGLSAKRPDFCTQQAQAHLHQAMVEVGQYDIIPA